MRLYWPCADKVFQSSFSASMTPPRYQLTLPTYVSASRPTVWLYETRTHKMTPTSPLAHLKSLPRPAGRAMPHHHVVMVVPLRVPWTIPRSRPPHSTIKCTRNRSTAVSSLPIATSSQLTTTVPRSLLRLPCEIRQITFIHLLVPDSDICSGDKRRNLYTTYDQKNTQIRQISASFVSPKPSTTKQ
jgi:hypothetical protein